MDRLLSLVHDRIATLVAPEGSRRLKVVVDDPVDPHTTEYFATVRQYLAKTRHQRDMEAVLQVVGAAVDAHHDATGNDGAFVAFVGVHLCRLIRRATHVAGTTALGGLDRAQLADDAPLSDVTREVLRFRLALRAVVDELLADTRQLLQRRRACVSCAELRGATFNPLNFTAGVSDPLLAALHMSGEDRPAPATPAVDSGAVLAACIAAKLLGDAKVNPLPCESMARVAQVRQAVRIVPVLRAPFGQSRVHDGVSLFTSDEGLRQSYFPRSWICAIHSADDSTVTANVLLLTTWSLGAAIMTPAEIAQQPCVVLVDDTLESWHLTWAESAGLAVVGNVGKEAMWRLALELDVVPYPDVTAPTSHETATLCAVHGLTTPAANVVDGIEMRSYASAGRRSVNWVSGCSVRCDETGVSEDHAGVASPRRSLIITVLAAKADNADRGHAGGPLAWNRSISVVVCAPAAAQLEQSTARLWSDLHRILGIAAAGFAVPGGCWTELVWAGRCAAGRAEERLAEPVGLAAARDALACALAEYVATVRVAITGRDEAERCWVAEAMQGPFRDFWRDDEWSDLTPARGPAGHCVLPVPPLQPLLEHMHDSGDADASPRTTLVAEIAWWDQYDERVAALRRAVALACDLALLTLTTVVLPPKHHGEAGVILDKLPRAFALA